MATPGPIHDPRPAPGDPRPFALGDGRLIIPADEIDRIAADHPGWIGRAPGDGPLYALPHAAIDRMATARPRLGAALGRHEARAEARFTDLCLDAGCVGAWADGSSTASTSCRPGPSRPPAWHRSASARKGSPPPAG